MKKKSLLVLLFAFVLSVAMLMTACGGGQKESAKPDDNVGKQEQQNAEPETTTAAMTLEDYLNQHADIKQSAIQAAEEQGVAVEFKGNELIYYFDLSKIDGYTEELAKSESIIAALESALIDGKQTFGEVSRDMEKATGITGVVTVVQYAWGDEVLVNKSFTTADAE